MIRKVLSFQVALRQILECTRACNLFYVTVIIVSVAEVDNMLVSNGTDLSRPAGAVCELLVLQPCRKIAAPAFKTAFTAATIGSLMVLMLLFGGCATQSAYTKQSFTPPFMYGNYPKTIAVLPFVNDTRDQDIADLMRIVFYCHLSVQPFEDVELHVVDRKLKTLNVTDAADIQRLPARELGQLLGAEAVVMGEIKEFERVFLGVYSQLSLGASIVVIDTRSGRKIWQDDYTVRVHEGGVPLTFLEIPFVSLRSGLNLTDKAKVRAADDLSRHLTMRIPAPVIPDYSQRIAATCPVPFTDYILNPRGDVSHKEEPDLK